MTDEPHRACDERIARLEAEIERLRAALDLVDPLERHRRQDDFAPEVNDDGR